MLTLAKGCNPKAYLNGTHLHLLARRGTSGGFPDTFTTLRSESGRIDRSAGLCHCELASFQ